MFVAHERPVTVSFAVAQARLTSLARGPELVDASRAAYSRGLADLLLPGPSGDVEGISELAAVRFLDPVHREEAMTLGLRWEAADLAGGLIPVLDADFRLTPQGRQATRLALSGSYRPPPGHPGISPDRAALNRAAAATIRILLRDVASVLATPTPDAGPDRPHLRGSRLPPRPGRRGSGLSRAARAGFRGAAGALVRRQPAGQGMRRCSPGPRGPAHLRRPRHSPGGQKNTTTSAPDSPGLHAHHDQLLGGHPDAAARHTRP